MGKNDHPYATELKKRVLKCAFFYLALVTPLILYARPIYTLFATPLIKILPANSSLIATDLTSPFMIPLKLALGIAFLIILPYILIQAWSFIEPALYPKEKKYIKVAFYFSISLFYSGLFFAYYIVCPFTFQFFAYMAPEGVLMMTDMGHYLEFVFKLMLAFGLTFQAPVILIALMASGILSSQSLMAKRPHIIVGSFVLGMLLTPPDVISQILLALPLWGLFELGLWIGKRFEPLPTPISDNETPSLTSHSIELNK